MRSIRRNFLGLLLVFLLQACSQDTKPGDQGQDPMTDAPDAGMTGDSVTGYSATDTGAISFSDIEDALAVRIIYFEYDSSQIAEAQRAVIEAHGSFLASNPDTRVVLEGHADERGSREYNLALGERRAIAVRQQLVLMGALESQIRVVSYGEERPAVEAHDEEAWQQNRRVEIFY
jgi:peptidoglycan-associated lipoprotein